MAEQFTSETALYTTTDPNGPDAAQGVVTSEPPASGFQLCGPGGVVDGAIVERLGIQGKVKPFDRDAALAENDAKNKATYGAADAGGRVADVAGASEPVKAASEPEPVKEPTDSGDEPQGYEAELTELVGEPRAKALIEAGFDSFDALDGADESALTDVEGVGAGTVKKIRERTK